MTFQQRHVVVLASNATFNQRYVIIPSAGFTHGASTIAGTTWTLTSPWIGAKTDIITANAKECRLLSFGVVIRNNLTATTSKGYAIVSSDSSPVLGGTTPEGLMTNSDAQIMQLAAGMEKTWVSRPTSESAHLFRPFATTYTSTQTDFDFTSLVIELVAQDATVNSLTVEIVQNWEFTVTASATNGLAQMQKTPPVPNRTALHAAEAAVAQRPSFMDGGISGATKYLEGLAMNALKSVATDAVSSLALLL